MSDHTSMRTRNTLQNHLPILRCPISTTSLSLVNHDELLRLNERILQREVRSVEGATIRQPVDDALCSADGAYLYPIREEILLLLPSHALPRERGEGTMIAPPRQEKQEMAAYYDEIGWAKKSEDLFADAAMFEDLRPVSHEYRHRCHLRVNQWLGEGGDYLLDAASGPLQLPEYLSYSDHFRTRICIDLSIVALREVKRKLGERALCIQADLTNLPIATGAVDGAISINTIYHIPADEQATAFRELYRTLKPQKNAVVVYTWGDHSPLTQITTFPQRMRETLLSYAKKVVAKGIMLLHPGDALIKMKLSGGGSGPKLYFHPHPPSWFEQQSWEFSYQMVVWRSVSVPFLQAYIHPALFGTQLLRFIAAVEERFPQQAGRLGHYPMFILTK